MALDRKTFGRLAEQAEARVIRGVPGTLPPGLAYVLVIHDPETRMAVHATNLTHEGAAVLMGEVVENIRAGDETPAATLNPCDPGA